MSNFDKNDEERDSLTSSLLDSPREQQELKKEGSGELPSFMRSFTNLKEQTKEDPRDQGVTFSGEVKPEARAPGVTFSGEVKPEARAPSSTGARAPGVTFAGGINGGPSVTGSVVSSSGQSQKETYSFGGPKLLNADARPFSKGTTNTDLGESSQSILEQSGHGSTVSADKNKLASIPEDGAGPAVQTNPFARLTVTNKIIEEVESQSSHDSHKVNPNFQWPNEQSIPHMNDLMRERNRKSKSSRPTEQPYRQSLRDDAEIQQTFVIPLRDKLILGPVDKYIKYGIFPWKFICHIGLMFLTAACVVFVIHPETSYSMQMAEQIQFIFMQVDDDGYSPPDPGETINIFSVSELKGFIAKIVNNYYELETRTMLDVYQLPRNKTSDEIIPLQFYSIPLDESAEVKFFELTPDDLGLFNPENYNDIELQLELFDTAKLDMYYSIKTTLPFDATTDGNCYQFNMRQTFDFKGRGVIEVKQAFDRRTCTTDYNPQDRTLWFFILLIAMCVLQNVGYIRYFMRASTYFNNLQKEFQQRIDVVMKDRYEDEDNSIESSSSGSSKEQSSKRPPRDTSQMFNKELLMSYALSERANKQFVEEEQKKMKKLRMVSTNLNDSESGSSSNVSREMQFHVEAQKKTNGTATSHGSGSQNDSSSAEDSSELTSSLSSEKQTLANSGKSETEQPSDFLKNIGKVGADAISERSSENESHERHPSSNNSGKVKRLRSKSIDVDTATAESPAKLKGDGDSTSEGAPTKLQGHHEPRHSDQDPEGPGAPGGGGDSISSDTSSTDSEEQEYYSGENRSDLDANQLEALLGQIYLRRDMAWDDLSLFDRLRLFKKWYLIAMLGNLCTIFGCVFFLGSNIFLLEDAEFMIGLGAMLTWISIVRYLENTKHYNLIFKTMNVAAPIIFRVVVGILPILIGATFLAISLFWQSEYFFKTVGDGNATLFAIQAGDALYDIFDEITPQKPLVGQIFLYLFIFLAVSLVQNLFLVIVEDSYVQIKYSSNFEWLDGGNQQQAIQGEHSHGPPPQGPPPGSPSQNGGNGGQGGPGGPPAGYYLHQDSPKGADEYISVPKIVIPKISVRHSSPMQGHSHLGGDGHVPPKGEGEFDEPEDVIFDDLDRLPVASEKLNKTSVVLEGKQGGDGTVDTSQEVQKAVNQSVPLIPSGGHTGQSKLEKQITQVDPKVIAKDMLRSLVNDDTSRKSYNNILQKKHVTDASVLSEPPRRPQRATTMVLKDDTKVLAALNRSDFDNMMKDTGGAASDRNRSDLGRSEILFDLKERESLKKEIFKVSEKRRNKEKEKINKIGRNFDSLTFNLKKREEQMELKRIGKKLVQELDQQVKDRLKLRKSLMSICNLSLGRDDSLMENSQNDISIIGTSKVNITNTSK